MNHLTDETLNEYLDHELANRASVDEHLATCADCAARLAVLQALFTELDSLPEETLSHNIAPRLTLPSHSPVFPSSLRLAVTLQAALAAIAIILVAPFATKLISPYLPAIPPLSFMEIVFRIQSQWMIWLDGFSTFHMPTLPQFPALEVSTLVLLVTLAGVSVLWLVGNGLLLRKQMK